MHQGRVENPRSVVATVKTGRVRVRLWLVAQRDWSWLWRPGRLAFACTPPVFRLRPLTPSTPAVPNCCWPRGSAPYWSNPPFLIFTARAYARAVLGVVILYVRPSVCPSVTRVDCDKTKWRTADIFIPHERAITLLLDTKSGWSATPPSLWNLRSKWPTPLRKTSTSTDFRT